MERKKLFKRIGLMLMILALTISHSARATEIVSFSLASNNTSTGGLSANSGSTMTIFGITHSNFSGTNGQTCYGWNAVGADRWQTTSFSTAGYIQLTVQGNFNWTQRLYWPI